MFQFFKYRFKSFEVNFQTIPAGILPHNCPAWNYFFYPKNQQLFQAPETIIATGLPYSI